MPLHGERRQPHAFLRNSRPDKLLILFGSPLPGESPAPIKLSVRQVEFQVRFQIVRVRIGGEGVSIVFVNAPDAAIPLNRDFPNVTQALLWNRRSLEFNFRKFFVRHTELIGTLFLHLELAA